MLRILVFDEPYSVKLRLEGKLTAQTVPVLTHRWAEVRSRLKGRKAILDLGDVVEVDESGRHMLAWLANSGARLGYAHPKVRPFVEDLACNEPGISRFSARIWKRLHMADCFERWDSPMDRLRRLVCAVLPPAWRPCGCRTV
jgi:ABC-type transporter Mla MlaB component